MDGALVMFLSPAEQHCAVLADLTRTHFVCRDNGLGGAPGPRMAGNKHADCRPMSRDARGSDCALPRAPRAPKPRAESTSPALIECLCSASCG